MITFNHDTDYKPKSIGFEDSVEILTQARKAQNKLTSGRPLDDKDKAAILGLLPHSAATLAGMLVNELNGNSNIGKFSHLVEFIINNIDHDGFYAATLLAILEDKDIDKEFENV